MDFQIARDAMAPRSLVAYGTATETDAAVVSISASAGVEKNTVTGKSSTSSLARVMAGMAGVALLVVVGVAAVAAGRGGGVNSSAPLGDAPRAASSADAPEVDAETMYRQAVLRGRVNYVVGPSSSSEGGEEERGGGSLGLITGRAETDTYGQKYASVPADAVHGECAFEPNTCDKQVYGTYQYVDASCTLDGGEGHGCVAAQGCRFCRTEQRADGQEFAPEQVDLNWCPPCVCEHYKVSGCAPAGVIGYVPGSPAAVKQAEKEEQHQHAAAAR